MSDAGSTGPSPFKYHLELTPAQLKLTYTALHSLLDDFGHEEHEVHEIIREVLEKLPDEHAIRAIRLDDDVGRGIAGAKPGAEPAADPATPPSRLGEPGGDPPDTVA